MSCVFLEHGLDVRDLRFLIEKFLGLRLERHAVRVLAALGAAPDPEGEGLEPGFLGLHRLRFALLLEGQVDLFQPVELEGGADHLLELGGELLLLLDLGQDEGLALERGLELLFSLDHFLDHHLVHIARLLFSVAGDEGHGAPLGGELDHAVRVHEGKAGELLGEPERKIHRRKEYGRAPKISTRSTRKSEVRRLGDKMWKSLDRILPLCQRRLGLGPSPSRECLRRGEESSLWVDSTIREHDAWGRAILRILNTD